jgi:hypothetical protein
VHQVRRVEVKRAVVARRAAGTYQHVYIFGYSLIKINSAVSVVFQDGYEP